LGGALTLEQIVKFLDLENEDISGRHWTIIPCSAMTGEGLTQGFEWVVSDISSRIFQMS
jgi:ADP-ribosylation factor-like protein 2